MKRSLLLAIPASAACYAFLAAAPAAPKPKAKPGFEAGKPAFTPSAETLAFDPESVTPQFLAADRFQVPEDLEVTLWASSPMLFNPANMDIDHAGRVWISEGINYRRHSGRSREGDAIRVLQDTDGDGKADKSHVFVREKELECPLGVAVFDNVIVVSNTPDLIVYTDVDRDLVFNPEVDTREVLLTGFEKPQHDHSLHSVIGGPDGRWHFSNGNCGAQFTDRSGRTFRIGSAYLGNDYTGQASDDGHVYVGGFSASIEPDGTDARILSHNSRNSYEGVITSFGELFQNDNDDPPACRVSHILEGGSFGFFSRDGSRKWSADRRPGQSTAVAEWRQEDPGSIPAGDVYGGGAPTGMAYYENGALPEHYRGLLLSCETGRNTIFGYQPEAEGAGFKLERTDFITTNTTGQFAGSDFVGGSKNLSTEDHVFFRPSDVCVGPDGAIYFTDWFDPRTGGHQDLDETCSGAVYRLAPKGFQSKVPELDLDTVRGQVDALLSPAINTRHVGFTRLREAGESVVDRVAPLLEHSDSYLAARAVWLLAQLGDAGKAEVTPRLQSESAEQRLLAFRALRAAGEDVVSLAGTLATDASPAVRREVALALRDVPFEASGELLVQLAETYPSGDRSYLEAWGLGATGKEAELWNELRTALGDDDPLKWSAAFADLTWRLHPTAAAAPVAERAASAKLSESERMQALDTLAFIPSQDAANAVLDLASNTEGALRDMAFWWLINRSTNDWAEFGLPEQLKERGIFDPDTVELVEIVTPETTPSTGAVTVDAVMALEGDATRGAMAITRCYMCHQVGEVGVDFGPALTGWGRSQPKDVIAEALIDPNKDIAHGFDGMEITTKDGLRIQGRILMDGDIVMIRSMGGQTQYVPKSRIAKKRKMQTSLMMTAGQLGMTAQDVADVIAFLKEH